MRSDDSLPFRTIAVYNLPVVAYGFMFMLFSTYYMKFATDVLLISPFVIGSAFGLARLVDAAIDPAVGYLSDRTRSRMGRRRPWLLLSAVPISLTFYMVFAPPASLTPQGLTIWVVLTVFAFYTAITVFVVPHMSLGAELTFNNHARNRLFGSRWALLTLGYTIALGAMSVLISLESEEGPAAVRSLASEIALVSAVIMAISLLYTSVSIKERKDFQGRTGRPYSAFADVLRNEHARKILFAAFVEHAGGAATGVVGLYVTEYVLKAPEYGPPLFLVWLVFSMAAVPVWLRLARHFRKRNLWVAALVLSAVSYGSLIFLGEGDVWFMMFIMVLTGSAAACGNTMGPSIQSDVIDYDEFVTGERKEGTYFACWNLVIKAAGGVTVVLAGVILQQSGFVAKAEQTELVKMSMLAYLALFPFVTYLAGAVVVSRLKFTEETHANIRAQMSGRSTDKLSVERGG